MSEPLPLLSCLPTKLLSPLTATFISLKIVPQVNNNQSTDVCFTRQSSSIGRRPPARRHSRNRERNTITAAPMCKSVSKRPTCAHRHVVAHGSYHLCTDGHFPDGALVPSSLILVQLVPFGNAPDSDPPPHSIYIDHFLQSPLASVAMVRPPVCRCSGVLRSMAVSPGRQRPAAYPQP